MMSLDERVRSGLQELFETPYFGAEEQLDGVVRRGRRSRRRIVGTSLLAAAVLLGAGGFAVTYANDARRDNAVSRIPSPVQSASAVNVEGTAQVSSTVVRAGEVFTITTTIKKYNGLSGFADIDTGDGRPHGGRTFLTSCLRDRGVPLPTVRRGQASGGLDKATYAYRNPGRYLITVTFLAYLPCSSREDVAGPVTFEIVVKNGIRRSAGPFDPYVFEGGINPGNDGMLHLDAKVRASHAWIRTITLSWEDGTRRVFTYPLGDCEDPKRYWPQSYRSISDRHAYQGSVSATGGGAKQDTRQIVITMVSTGCDGRNARTATFRHTFTTPLRQRDPFFGGRLFRG